MSITALLRPTQDALERLTLWRVQLDQQYPAVALSGVGVEGVLYGLTGTVNLYVDGQYSGSFGQRERLQEEVAQAVRFRGCGDITLTLAQRSYAADALWITCGGIQVFGASCYQHLNDAHWHTVGEGTHLRRVAEIPTPPGCAIYCGETHSGPGGISSWPPHATKEDIEKFSNGETTWEECMLFVCEKPGIVNMKGVYTGGKIVNRLFEVENGSAHVMCLGSHTIYSAPDSTIVYPWFYVGNALQKTYNQFSTDLLVYKK